MAVLFAVLASGSRGNATLIRSAGAGVLLDVGIGPRDLTARLESVGSSWDEVRAALLTHTHGDHVREHTLLALLQRQIPLYCHEGHRLGLGGVVAFQRLEAAGLVRSYDERPFLTPIGMQVEPFQLQHDSEPTFGFRLEARDGRHGRSVSIGYLADTGTWTEPMADLMAEVDLLGVEFNHDVTMQLRSGRPRRLIDRVLGDRGHLSNDQGADLVAAVLGRSGRGALRHVVLLHLSEQCNRPAIALKTARAVIRGTGRRVAVHAAPQRVAQPGVWLEPARRSRPTTSAAAPRARRSAPTERELLLPWFQASE